MAHQKDIVRWLGESGFHVHWTRFIPEDESGHTLVFAQKPSG